MAEKLCESGYDSCCYSHDNELRCYRDHMQWWGKGFWTD